MKEMTDWLEHTLQLMLNNNMISEQKPEVYSLTPEFSKRCLETAFNVVSNPRIRECMIIDGYTNHVSMFRKANDLAKMVTAIEFMGGMAKTEEIERIYTILVKIQEFGESGV